MRRTWAVIGLFLVVALAGCASRLSGASPGPALEARFELGGGWHEAVIQVSDLERTSRFFTTVAGWRVLAEGDVSAAERAAMGAGSATAGRYRVLLAPDHPQGWVRLIELEGPPRPLLRPHAQPWDTGGIFSLMTRSSDLTRNLADAEALGWLAYNQPYDFGFGPLQLRNIVLRGPDGLNVAIYEWLQPRREEVASGALTKPFNAMQMVADLAAARAFYVDVLGFRVIQEGRFLDPEPRPTNFALPVGLATQVARDYVILIPEGADDETGRVELMHFAGLEGQDFRGRASLIGLGLSSLRFPVADIDAAYARYVTDRGASALGPIVDLPMPPFGGARAFTLRSPDGALLTFFQRVDAGSTR